MPGIQDCEVRFEEVGWDDDVSIDGSDPVAVGRPGRLHEAIEFTVVAAVARAACEHGAREREATGEDGPDRSGASERHGNTSENGVENESGTRLIEVYSQSRHASILDARFNQRRLSAVGREARPMPLASAPAEY